MKPIDDLPRQLAERLGQSAADAYLSARTQIAADLDLTPDDVDRLLLDRWADAAVTSIHRGLRDIEPTIRLALNRPKPTSRHVH